MAGLAPVFEAVGAAVLWGSIGVVYRYAVAHGASPGWLIAGRPLLAGVPATAACLVAGCGRPSRWSLLVGLLGLGPLYASYFLAVERVGAALASLLLYTAPLWVVALSPLATGERPGRRQVYASLLGFAGAALLVASPGGRGDALGYVLGLASGASYAVYMLVARLAALRGARPVEVSVYSLPFAGLAVLPVAHPSKPLGGVDAAAMLYLAVLGTLVPYTLSARSLRALEAYRVAVISLVEPLTAVLLAVLVLGERLTLLQAVGAAAVLASALAAAGGRR